MQELIYGNILSKISSFTENRTFYEIDLMVKSRTSNAVKTVKELYQSLNPGDFPEPPPPMVIKPTPLSSTNIKLQWEKPKTSLPIVNYTVRYQQREGEEMFNIEDRSHSFDVYVCFVPENHT